MKITNFNFKTTIAALCIALFASLSLPAAVTVVQAARSYSAAGNVGCTVSGATVATPSVITCAAAHNAVSGDQVQITGIVGTTTDNTLAYVNVLSSTTVALYSDVNLSIPITGTGAYSSGGVMSQATDISGFTGDWTIDLRIEGLTAGKRALISVQDSTDGFVSDIKTLAVYNVIGAIANNQGQLLEHTFRAYELPSARFGTANGRLRLYVQSIDSSATVVASLFIKY